MAVARDYLVPLPTPGMDGATARMAEHGDVSAMTRALFEELLLPVAVTSGQDRKVRWVVGKRRLLPEGWADAFTEHSPRKCLVSWGSPLPGVARGHLDLLGWHSTSASLGYDQSVGQVVANVQEIVSRSVPSLALKYSEVDLHEMLAMYMSSRFHLDIPEVWDVLKPVTFESVAAVLMHTAVSVPSSSFNSSSQVQLPFPDVAFDLEALQDDDKPGDVQQEALRAPYWGSVSARTAYRRLHRRGGCGFRAIVMEPVWDLAEVQYNSQCGHCWKPQQKCTPQSARDGEV